MEDAVENSRPKRTRSDEEADGACYGTAKKPRVRWTADLHGKFLQAIAVIVERKNPYKRFGRGNGSGESQVGPKEVLEEMRKMGVKGLDRHNVSSHLQKHRGACIKNKTKGGEPLDRQRNTKGTDPSYPAQCCYLPVMESGFSAPAAAALYQYPDADYYRYPFLRNFPVDYPMQRPGTYFNSGIGQRIDPHPLPIAQQLMIPRNRPVHQPSMWNPGCCCNVDVIGTAPRDLQFTRAPSTCFGTQNLPMTAPGPHSANSSGFSASNDRSEFIGRGSYAYSTDAVPSVSTDCLWEPSGRSANISTGPYSPASLPSLSSQSPEAESKIINPEFNFPSQHALIGPDTNTAAANDSSNTGHCEAPAATLCDQDIGLLDLDGLDASWLETLLAEGIDLD